MRKNVGKTVEDSRDQWGDGGEGAECVVASGGVVLGEWGGYGPRPEKVESGWGGDHVKLDRVEWRIMPDASTAANALATGEIDWVENPLPDLLPMLRRTPGVTIGRIDTHGVFPVLRPNFVSGPTMNPVVRRAMLAAIHQEGGGTGREAAEPGQECTHLGGGGDAARRLGQCGGRAVGGLSEGRA